MSSEVRSGAAASGRPSLPGERPGTSGDGPRLTPNGDPRLSNDHVRELPGTDGSGDVVLVGAVHDHPASTYRVRTVVEDLEPDVLALELPPVAIPLYEAYADDPRSPPAFGGEMSAAVQASTVARVVGIDGPTLGFTVRLARTLVRDGASVGTVRSILGSLRSVTRIALRCRLAAWISRRADVRIAIDDPTVYDCCHADDPQEQAADERDQVRRARAVANVFGTPDAVRVRDTVREAYMADRLSSLRRDGDVVAVVGIDHLEPLVDLLDGTPTGEE